MKVLYVDLEREWRGGQSQALLTLRGLQERAQLLGGSMRIETAPTRGFALEFKVPA